MTDQTMTHEQALEWLEGLRNATGDQVCAEIEAGKAAEAAQAFRAALSRPAVPETLAKWASNPEEDDGIGWKQGYEAARRWVAMQLSWRSDLTSVVNASSATEPAGEPCRTINIDDIVAWADGVQGALGTEHANRVTEREAAASRAVMAAIASAPDRCPHGVRRPHECKECADAVPASEALEWAEREFAVARQSPGEPVPVETTAEESLGDASEPVYRLTIRDDRSDVIDACPALLDLDPGHYELHARPESAEGDSE